MYSNILSMFSMYTVFLILLYFAKYSQFVKLFLNQNICEKHYENVMNRLKYASCAFHIRNCTPKVNSDPDVCSH